MKRTWALFLIMVLLTAVFITGECLAKEYKVVLDDKYVTYFENQESVKEIGAEDWLRRQALNAADEVISNDYDDTRKSSRDDKITEIEK